MQSSLTSDGRGLKVLAIDTCLNACQAAVVQGGESLAMLSEPMSRGHQERLATMVRDVMNEAGLAFSDLDLIGVTVGPGSFTGLRVGLAFAKGLALALDRSCVGVGSLEALAASTPGDCARVAVIDAGRGRVFAQMFVGAAPLSPPELMDLETAPARFIERRPLVDFMVTGPGATLFESAWPACSLASLDFPSPLAIARLAATGPGTKAEPLYLRPPDATPKVRTIAP